LIADIGDKLGCGAHVIELRRIGFAHVDIAQTLKFAKNPATLVACPKQIGNMPLASGSNAPVCPAFLAKNKRLTFCFFETEKLIRKTANLSLEVTSQQAINQLRYAAHPILKSDKQEDVIEAYKHCKRAYYDTLDLFILTLNDRFVTSLVYVKDSEKRKNIAEKLKKILIKIQTERFKVQTRVEYYDSIRVAHLLF
jgi:tRNA U55 pseudouridine synthase TruB